MGQNQRSMSQNGYSMSQKGTTTINPSSLIEVHNILLLYPIYNTNNPRHDPQQASKRQFSRQSINSEGHRGEKNNRADDGEQGIDNECAFDGIVMQHEKSCGDFEGSGKNSDYGHA